MFIDTHCHPYSRKDISEEEIISSFLDAGGKNFVSIGVDIKTSNQSIELAKKYDFVYATIGIHPCDWKQEDDIEKIIGELGKLYIENKENIVGIGECGLDYYWMEKEISLPKLSPEEEETKQRKKEQQKEIQKKYFISQIKLAERYNLPFIIHNRDAKEDTLEILKKVGYKNFILHCFTENLDFANKLLDFAPNCKISFSGIITFKNALEIQETAKNIPLKNIIVETDSPYLTPAPYRGKKENRPAYVGYVLDKIIELRSETPEEIEKQIYENSKEVFGI